jgi:hypothetical protein
LIRERFDRRSSAVVLGGAIALAVGLANCANSINVGYQDNDAGTFEAGTGIFVGNDAGDASLAAVDAGLMCSATECPWPWVSCIGSDGTLPAYACGTNVSSDLHNCGGCNVMCDWGPPTFHLSPTCMNGECKTACAQGYFDCNGIPDDGCEV